MEVIVVGAGLAGLSCARGLAEAGHAVRLLDKGRGPGGRASTRRIEVDGRTYAFDHGAQYFTARDPGFHAEVERWRAASVAGLWPAAGADAWVGTPGMNAPVRALAAGLDVTWSTRVERIARVGSRWRVTPGGDGDDAVEADAMVLAIPAEQAAALAPDPAFRAIAGASVSEPCWTAMLAFAHRLPIDGDAHRLGGAIAWAARDGAKPGRAATETWVVQASPEWSRAHLEETPDDALPALTAAFADAMRVALPVPIVAAAHRWRYARCATSDRGFLWDADAGLGACGDWLRGPRIEDAWLSGRRLADAMVARPA